jgi:hypothetical protein
VPENRLTGQTRAAHGLTEQQRTAVQQEVQRIVAHPAFKGSRRSIDLFRYLTEYVSTDNEGDIKERTLGVEVFGRPPDYDTNEDPIVRRTANEIRKRLAQYYQETRGPVPVRIELIRGSYVPEFQFEGDEGHSIAMEEGLGNKPESSPDQNPIPEALHRVISRKWLLAFVAALVAVGVYVFVFRLNSASRSPQYRVWMPLLQAGQPISMCLSDQTGVIKPAESTLAQAGRNLASQTSASTSLERYASDTPFTDAHVADQISALLAGYKGRTTMKPCSALSFQEMRQRPTVLIGGTNNPWALSLLANLRYSIQLDPATQDKWIQDAQDPAKRDWRIDGKLQNTDASPDYAVISRFYYKESGQWVVAISGLEAHGTEAAGELVADPEFAKYLPASIRSDGNFQILLRVDVLHGTTGPFNILSVHSW